MNRYKYFIVGCSHAGLAAVDAIRLQDKQGSLIVLTDQKYLPYSPTILPYVLSGHKALDQVFLRNEESLKKQDVLFRRSAKVIKVDTGNRSVILGSGESIGYEKLLIATGASPKLPPLQGLGSVPYHVLRTLEDAERLRMSIARAKKAVILGGGLVGLHAAEHLAAAGLKVTVVEAMPRLLAGYFDEESARLICRSFLDNGIAVLASENAVKAEAKDSGCVLTLASGKIVSCDLLLVATGIKPCFDCLAGSDIRFKEGILVDSKMRTSADFVWAAGDVAQAVDFAGGDRINAILPNAVEQGRIAGMDMVGDPDIKSYPGSIALTSYGFFGRHAFSVGNPLDENGTSVEMNFFQEAERYEKLVFKGEALVGAIGVNSMMDPGVIARLIRRKVGLGEFRAGLAKSPVDMSRVLMTEIWR